MKFFDDDERKKAQAILALVTTNPFDGDQWPKKQQDFVSAYGGAEAKTQETKVLSWEPESTPWTRIDALQLPKTAKDLADGLRSRQKYVPELDKEDLELYELLVAWCAYRQIGEEMDKLIAFTSPDQSKMPGTHRNSENNTATPSIKNIWRKFKEVHEGLLLKGHLLGNLNYKQEHIFACFWVFRRVIHLLYNNIVGKSKPIAQLRAAVWESIFTWNLINWIQGLHACMKDVPTLITGNSGTGKELVANAIGGSLYIPFNTQKMDFETNWLNAFKVCNLTALNTRTLESELFGHIKGAFTTALNDKPGKLEECPEHGATFLDEIGDVNGEIQVKLLRVLEQRCFESVGSNDPKPFKGKVITATNRNLVDEMQAGRFREDFYYRICADQIHTPSLYEQLKDEPQELKLKDEPQELKLKDEPQELKLKDEPQELKLKVEFLCRKILKVTNFSQGKINEFIKDIVKYINEDPVLSEHTWPGNVRELEHCIQSYLIHRSYKPVGRNRAQTATAAQLSSIEPDTACGILAQAVVEKKLKYKDIDRILVEKIYAKNGKNRAQTSRLMEITDFDLKGRLGIRKKRSGNATDKNEQQQDRQAAGEAVHQQEDSPH